MNLKDKFTSFFASEEPPAQVRVEGSLSGNALLEEGSLGRLNEVVRAVSEQRSYSYDLDLSAGRFSVMLVEPRLSLESFVVDPETDIAQDLQNIVDALPPQERTKLVCTFRLLWQDQGEVTGVAFQIEPPGRVKSERRMRPEEEYDRLADEQTLDGLGYPSKSRIQLPKWAMIILGIAAVAIVALYYYDTSPARRWEQLTTVMEQRLDLNGFETLLEIDEVKINADGIRFTIFPLMGCEEVLQKTMAQPEAEITDASGTIIDPLVLEALRKKELHLEFLDETGSVGHRIRFLITDFDGREPIKALLPIPSVMQAPLVRAHLIP